MKVIRPAWRKLKVRSMVAIGRVIDNPIKVQSSTIQYKFSNIIRTRTETRRYETRRRRVKTLIASFTGVERSKDAFFPDGGCCVKRKQEDNAVTGSPRESFVHREVLGYFSDNGLDPVSSLALDHSHVPVLSTTIQSPRDGTNAFPILILRIGKCLSSLLRVPERGQTRIVAWEPRRTFHLSSILSLQVGEVWAAHADPALRARALLWMARCMAESATTLIRVVLFSESIWVMVKLRRIGVQRIFARDSELGKRFFDTRDKHFFILSPLEMFLNPCKGRGLFSDMENFVY